MIAAVLWFVLPACAQDMQTSTSAAASPVRPDQVGTPLKPELPGTPTQSGRTGTILEPAPTGAAVKAEQPGLPVKSEAAGTPEGSKPAGTQLAPEPSGTPTVSESTAAPVVLPLLPEKKITLYALRKKQADALAALKKEQTKEIKKLRENLKGKPQPDIKKAVRIKRAEQERVLKDLENFIAAETAQFVKDQPEPAQQGGNTTGK